MGEGSLKGKCGNCNASHKPLMICQIIVKWYPDWTVLETTLVSHSSLVTRPNTWNIGLKMDFTFDMGSLLMCRVSLCAQPDGVEIHSYRCLETKREKVMPWVVWHKLRTHQRSTSVQGFIYQLERSQWNTLHVLISISKWTFATEFFFLMSAKKRKITLKTGRWMQHFCYGSVR